MNTMTLILLIIVALIGIIGVVMLVLGMMRSEGALFVIGLVALILAVAGAIVVLKFMPPLRSEQTLNATIAPTTYATPTDTPEPGNTIGTLTWNSNPTAVPAPTATTAPVNGNTGSIIVGDAASPHITIYEDPTVTNP